MKIEEVAVEKLIPYERNNKIHGEEQVNRIANSIKEFGFLQPIVIDKQNIVIVGHGRLEGAKKLGLETVPCIRAENLTEKQIKQYRILDNKLNESEYDLANLKSELDSIGDFNIGDLEISVDELFPEFETPEFDENEFDQHDESGKIGNEYGIIITFNSPEEQQVMYESLKDMGTFKNIKLI